MTGGVAVSSAASAAPATSAPASGQATPVTGKRQCTATDADLQLGDPFDYLVSQLSKFSRNFDEVNTPLGADIRALKDEDISDAESISLTLLLGLANSIHKLTQAHMDT
jgi:hypothetical protein